MTLNIIKNTEKAGYYGSMFGQDVEPKGTYVLEKPEKWTPNGRWSQGIVDLNKPLYIDITDDTQISYKYDLAKEYKAKGASLTKKLMNKGYDAIITRYPNGDSGEIILFPNSKFMLHTNESINNRIKVKNIILKEVANTRHQLDRFKTRFNILCQGHISSEDKNEILRNLNTLNQIDLDNKSYAVRIGGFKVNKDSEFYIDVNGRGYYRVNDELFKDSTGNEFWAIVRNNRIITFMLRKDIQSRDVERMKDRLRVDDIIFDVNKINKPVSEGLIDEDFTSHNELVKIVEDMFRNFLYQFVKKTFLLKKEPENFTCNVFNGLTYRYGELNKFVNEFSLFLRFMKTTGRGNFQGLPNGAMGSIRINADPNIIYNTFLDNYDVNLSEKEIANEMYYSLRSSELMSVMLHELQHAYDYYRSEGKFTSSKKSEKFYDKQRKGITTSDDPNLSKLYYSLPEEVQARFTQALADVPYYENNEMIPLKQYVGDVIKFFGKWEMLSDKQKKTIIRKTSQYYHKYKEEFDKNKKGE